MKKLMLFLLVLLLVPVLCLAQSTTELEPGTTLNGFTLLSVDEIELLHTTMYLFEHDKTGAQLVYMANDDTDRTFEITFHTPVDNDKGLPHVFEHAALSGSMKYPDSNLVFSMMYGTYSTYINAFTSTTFTSFPVSSQSEDQLFMNMDVYLSGVFFPQLMEDERAMMREAYRYELESPEADITLQGTVYSEMLGAMTQQRMDYYRLKRLLFPGSVVGSVSGGLPDEIPEMTYQELLDFHKKYYTPSNCMVTLYGDLEIERFLTAINEVFDQFERTEVDITDACARIQDGAIEASYTYPAPADAEAETNVYYAIPVNELDSFTSMILSIDLGIMSEADHLLDREMSSRLPNVTWSVDVDGSTAGYAIIFSAQGIQPEEAKTFREICDAAIEEIHQNGFDPEDVQMYADYQRYSNALQGESSGGISWCTTLAQYWDLYKDTRAILSYFELIDDLTVLNSRNLCNQEFENALDGVTSSVLMISTSEPGKQEEIAAQRAQKLKDMKVAMSEEEIAALVARTADYNAWADQNATASMLSKVTAVHTEDLPEEVLTAESVTETKENLTVISSAVEDTDYIRVRLFFDTSSLPEEVLLPLNHMTDELTNSMPTSLYDRTAIERKTTKLTNGFTVSMSTIRNESTGEWTPYLVVGWATFEDLAAESFDLVKEILLNTDLSDSAYIRSYVASSAQSSRNSAVYNAPHALALRNAMRQMSEEDAYSYLYGGINQIQYYESLAELDDEAFAAEIEKAQQALRMVFSSDHVIMTVIGCQNSIDEAVPMGQQLLGDLKAESLPITDTPATTATSKSNTAILINTNINFNLEYLPLEDTGMTYSPALDVFANIASDKVLMPVLRFQNSVYSPIFSLSRYSCFLLTYRDPQLAKMYNDIFPTLGGLVRTEMESLDQTELEGYIGSVYTALAEYEGPITRAAQAISNVLQGEDAFELKKSYMETLKQLKPEELVQYADVLDQLSQDGLKVSVTSPQAYSECPELFETVDESYLK